jgi:hypothetical protein
MAFLNLLGGNFVGRLGTYYGSRSKVGVVTKVVPFSKAPPSVEQMQNVRAFEALNRVAAVIARAFWPFLGLVQGLMHKHNRVASWLRTAIVTHVFLPASIADVIPEDGTLSILSFTLNPAAFSGHLQLSLSAPYPGASGGAFLYMVFDQFGYKYLYGTGVGSGINLDFPGSFPPGRTFYAMAFRSDKVGGSFFVHGYDLAFVTLPAA